jgi:hypothetical protein
MGINIDFFLTPPDGLRAWALDRLPAWWAAWTGLDPEIPEPASAAWHTTAPFDRLAALVDRVRPLLAEPGPGCGDGYFEVDRPTRSVFGRALRLLRSGESAWRAGTQAEAFGMDQLVRHLLRDTDYRLRYPSDGDVVGQALVPLGCAEMPWGKLHMRWNMIPQTARLPARSSPELRRLWAALWTGRTVAVVAPEHAVEAVEPCIEDDEFDSVFGWFTQRECAVLVAEIDAVEGEPLAPEGITEQELRWIAGLERTIGAAMADRARRDLAARQEEIPWRDAHGLHVVHDLAREAAAGGRGLGFLTG